MNACVGWFGPCPVHGERLSPHCLDEGGQLDLFGDVA